MSTIASNNAPASNAHEMTVLRSVTRFWRTAEATNVSLELEVIIV
jgi:hypothetical protein